MSEGYQPKPQAMPRPPASRSTPTPVAGQALRVYLVPTGEVYCGQETYTRHEDHPPVNTDSECLYAAPQPNAEHVRLATADTLNARLLALRDAVADVFNVALGRTDSSEALTRYCPGCGSVGPVDEKYRDCCPDGAEARMIPASLAEKCRDTFKVAVGAPLANAAASSDGAPETGEAMNHDRASLQKQAASWGLVCRALDEVAPGWANRRACGRDCASAAIRKLAGQRNAALEEAARFVEKVADCLDADGPPSGTAVRSLANGIRTLPEQWGRQKREQNDA